VFASTLEKVHEPIFAPIEFQLDIAARRARLVVSGVTEGRGEPILNPVTGAQHRVRIDMEGAWPRGAGDGTCARRRGDRIGILLLECRST
jgi:hypothetical protein